MFDYTIIKRFQSTLLQHLCSNISSLNTDVERKQHFPFQRIIHDDSTTFSRLCSLISFETALLSFFLQYVNANDSIELVQMWCPIYQIKRIDCTSIACQMLQKTQFCFTEMWNTWKFICSIIHHAFERCMLNRVFHSIE